MAESAWLFPAAISIEEKGCGRKCPREIPGIGFDGEDYESNAVGPQIPFFRIITELIQI
jgi:hypothetical protein